MLNQAVFQRWILSLVLTTVSLSSAWGWQTEEPVPYWIWSARHQAGHIPQTSCYFRKTVTLPAFQQAMLAVAADDQFEIYLNGQLVGEGTADQGIRQFNVTGPMREGDNTIAVKVTNREGGTAGLAARLKVVTDQKQELLFVTDAGWKVNLSPILFWNRNAYADGRWQGARTLGSFANFEATVQSSTGKSTSQTNSQGNAVASAKQQPGSENSTTKSQEHAATSTAGRGFQLLKRQPAAGEQLEVPREFELEQVAGHVDIGSTTAITFNEFGQLIAAREDGQLWLLSDEDKDGTLDSVRDYGKVTQTCQGLLSLNGHVYVTGLGDEGLALYRLTDTDRDGKLDASRAMVKFQGDNIEHGPHGITLGPDGMLYVMVGNHSPLSSPYASTSPYRYTYEGDLLQPRFEDPGGHARGVKAPGGYILRTDTEGRKSEVYAGGLRNAYDLAFDHYGNLFTHDSDMESDRGTTWYRPTQVYHVIDGAEFGWRSGWAKWPEYYLDLLPSMADTGRGSPTGMVVYDHDNFPSIYRHAIFSCDWSEGRILVMACAEQGATVTATPKPFVQGKPLNVTDIEVGPDGGLYFATGGRGTAGNVYRVSWKGFRPSPLSGLRETESIAAALRQPQINSSWSRQEIARIKSKLGTRWASELTAAAEDLTRSDDERIQALQIMQWVGPAPTVDLLSRLAGDRRVIMRRYAARLLGTKNEADAQRRLVDMLSDPDRVVRRVACESLARWSHPAPLEDLTPLLTSTDRFESWAARRVLETMPRDDWESEILQSSNQRLFLVGATALVLAHPQPDVAREVIDRSLDVMQGFINDQNFVDLIRLQQLALMRSGIKIDELADMRQVMADEYPSSSLMINRELIRLLAYLQVDSIGHRFLSELERDLPSEDKLHLAMNLTYIKSGWTTEQKLGIFQHLVAGPGAGNSLPGYLQNAAEVFGKLLSDEELSTAIAMGHQNPGSALAAILRLPESLSSDQLAQIKQLDQRLGDQSSEMSRRLKVAIIAILARDGSSSATEYLRTIYDRDPPRRVEAALGLAATDDPDNWPYMVQSLPILEKEDAKQMVMLLREMRRVPDNAEAYRQVLLTAQRLGDDGADEAIKLLEHWQGYAPSGEKPPWKEALVAWKKWFTDSFPTEPTPELVVQGTGAAWDEQALLKHLTRAEQEGLGSASAGQLVFEKASCAKCHRFGTQGESMGPDLTGVAKRFLKRELLDSMLYPSKVISDQYAAKTVFTESGQVYTGIVAQGAGDEVVVLQSNGTKVRLPGDEVEEIERARISAMPEGLLNGLSLEEITDLFAYLYSDADRLAERTEATTTRK